MFKAILIGAALLALGSARAKAVVYSFTPTLLDVPAPPFLTPEDLSFTLAIDDVAVRSGFFSYDYRNRYIQSGSPPRVTAMFSATGDVQSLQLFQNAAERVSFSSGGGPEDSSSAFFDVSLNFDESGQASGGIIEYSTDGYFIFIGGTNQVFSGIAGIGTLRPAHVTGPLVASLATSVPEPTTVALLGIALGLVVQERWRRNAS